MRALQATRQAALGQLAEAQANLAERQIVAPTDGTILSRPVEVGDVVSPGSPVFVMVDMNRLYVKVYVPEPDIPKIQARRSGGGLGRRVSRPDVFAARVSKISDRPSSRRRTSRPHEERLKLVFGVELSFVNPDRVLKPGMPADGVIHWVERVRTERAMDRDDAAGSGRSRPVAILRPLRRACRRRPRRVVRGAGAAKSSG